ncbi:11212_t:CDS:2, partial [Gigaspora rosea]
AFFLANVSLDFDTSEAEMSSKVSRATPVTINSYNLSQQPHVDFIGSTPSSITRLLTYSSPLSCLLVAAWWTICLYPRELIIYGTHIGLISWISWNWVERGKSERLGKSNFTAASQLDLNKTVQEIHTISDKLASFHKVLNHVNSYINWSDPVQTRKLLFCLAYSYPVWILFNYFVSLSWTFIIVVDLLTLYLVFEGLQQEGSKSFSVRTRDLTDLFHTFELPQRKVTETKSPENPNILIRKTIEWEWVDTDWWIDSEGATDKEGWEYFDNRWSNPSSKGGFRKYTRRRKWAKTAKMIETIQKIENPSNSTSNSDEKIEPNENTDDSCINNESSLNDHNIEGSSTQIKNPHESLSMKKASS